MRSDVRLSDDDDDTDSEDDDNDDNDDYAKLHQQQVGCYSCSAVLRVLFHSPLSEYVT